MNIAQKTWSATMAAIKAFREEFTSSNPLLTSEEFNSYSGRVMRYSINWSMYENTAYRNFNKWAEAYKTTYGLYRYIRNIYNPSMRLGDFWQSHLWGGLLDSKAGDGKQQASAIPISMDVENAQLRNALAQVWEWSNWQVEKDVVTLRGAVLGDSFIKVVDDVARKKTYLLPIHPSTIKDVVIDNWGNVKSYIIEERRLHPVNGLGVRYREEATRDGDNVIYRTFLDDSLYAWDGESAEWEAPYGFVPMVHIRHRHVGLKWGWSEMHAGIGNFREVDDQASLLNDQIRKMVNSVWFFAGVNGASGTVSVASSTPDINNPQAGREDLPALYGPQGSTATPLVSPLDISSTLANIENMNKKIERDYPELSDNLSNSGGDTSGRALRIIRQPVIDRVEQRRPNYDAALVRAQQMAVSISGWRGYGGAFDGFDLDSFAAGKLAHSIGTRPVFSKDPLDDLEVESAFWLAANSAKTAGMPLSLFLKRNGWAEKDIKEFEISPEATARLDAMQASANASRALGSGEIKPPVNPQTQSNK